MRDEAPDILKKICRAKQDEIDNLRARDRSELEERAAAQSEPRGFRRALSEPDDISLIAEVKKASPSAGVIRPDFDPVDIARAYEDGGAACLSVLTNEEFFQGRLDFLSDIRGEVALPLLRKDFILDELQVLEARAWGADCVLLIVAALEGDRLEDLLEACRELGMDALVEVHDRDELEAALEAGAEMVGVNNRDLRTFEVSLATAEWLAPDMPESVTKVAESGIHGPRDVQRMARAGYDAVLVGEHLMRHDDVATAARKLMEY